MVFAKAVEGAYQAAADYQADCEAEGDAQPDLLDEAFVEGAVVGGAEGLFQEGEEDGDDDAGFEAFAEADEEDWFGYGLAMVEIRRMNSRCDLPGTANTFGAIFESFLSVCRPIDVVRGIVESDNQSNQSENQISWAGWGTRRSDKASAKCSSNGLSC